MEVSMENTSTLGRRVKVSVPDATVNEQIKARMAKLAKEAHLKGFRPGKVPLKVLQDKFGESVRMEVINELIRQSLGDAVKENELQLAGTPKIEELKAQTGENLEFVATFEVYPQIALASLAGVEIEKRSVKINDADVESMMSKLQDQLANWSKVERAVKKGDKLTVDFSRLLKEEGSTKEEQKQVQMVVGVEGVLPGLSEALYGKQSGDEVEVELRYPEDWADKPAAGKDVTLWVRIHDVLEKQPLSNEELAQKLGIEDKETDKLKSKVRERMEEELEKALQDEIKESVLEKLLEKNVIEIPVSLIDQEKEAIRREISRSRRVNVPMEALKSDEVEQQAKRRVELGLLLNEVIKKYGLKADGQKVRAEVEKIAAKFPKPAEIVEAYYGSNELLYGIERVVLLDQAVEAILKEVAVKETTATFDEVMNPTEEDESK
jgi:trigger factor